MASISLPVNVITQTVKQPLFELYYPIVVGLKNTSAEQKINNKISETVNFLINKQGYYTSPQTDLISYYELKSNERDILSLNIINYAYHYHAAHGLTIIKSLNFDVNSGKNYKLSQLFKPESDYVKNLSDIIAAQIKSRDITLLDEFKGISPEQDFYIADKCLVVYFQLYELTAYVFGFPMFPISVYEIQDIILEDGPLGKMAQNN